MNKFFELRGSLPKRTKIVCEIIGVALIIIMWQLVVMAHVINTGLLPAPLTILQSFKELHFEDAVVRNLGYSYGLNLLGMMEAILIAIPIGFAVGLVPVLRAIFSRYITAVRFLPLSALVGIFIAICGIGSNMKVQFLAFSIFIYLLPVVISRIDAVEVVYLNTAKTLGATKFQTIRRVFIPHTLSHLIDDIRNLSALSWTYIIIAEMVNASGGGIGALAFKASRQSRIDKVFMILIIIIIIGIIQDKILTSLGQLLFPYKAEEDKR